MSRDTIDQKISSTIIEYKISNKQINTITIGHNEAMELEKIVEFEIPKDSGFIGSVHGVGITLKNIDSWFEVNENRIEDTAIEKGLFDE